MEGNTELLNYIYQNSEMGLNTIKQLVDMVDNDNFKQQLNSELNEYTEINNSAKTLLSEKGCDEKGIGQMSKIRTYVMINLQTLTDKSASHISEMLITGSTMGIIQAIKNIKKYKDAKKEILDLMSKLLKFEEHNVETLKGYL
jgi:hypothetical protein